MQTIESIYRVFQQYPHISTDSRNIIPGSIFFALKGPSFNGNAFAQQALDKGAVLAVVDEAPYAKGGKCVLVDDGLQALQQLALHHRRQLKIPVLAVTGSNGKTTTKELIRAVLSKKYRTLATKGNLNNHIGVPLTLLSITPDIEFAVIEMGANHQKEIESYCLIAEPDFGLITNVGKAHLEGFGGFEGVKKGKGELYDWISTHGMAVFLNGDNVHLRQMADSRQFKTAVRYGTDAAFDCRGELLSVQPTLEVKWQYGHGKETAGGQIRSQIIGEYNFENILSAVCIGNYFGVSSAQIDEAVAAYVSDNSRSQVVMKGTNKIILDAYNANPTSMEAALRNFSALPDPKKVVCIGDMAELGEASETEHERIAMLVKEGAYSKVIFVGKNFGVHAARLGFQHFENSLLAAEWVKAHPFSMSTVLVKGSRSTKMEVILDAM